MAYLYREFKNDRNERCSIRRLSDNASITTDPLNTDYKEFLYLASLLGEENILEAAS